MPRLVCLDFDGVLHHRRYWEEAITGQPVANAIPFLCLYQQHFIVAVFSSRSATPDGRRAMITFLYQNGVPFDILQWDDALETVSGRDISAEPPKPIRFPATKPWAGVFIDDRSWPPWDGKFPTVQELERFEPWWKK